MISESELVTTVGRIEVTVLRRWVERGWVVPHQQASGPGYDEQDVARVALICDLIYDIAIEEDSMPVVLSLIDQLHDMRRLARVMAKAIEKQPDSVRQQITDEVAEALSISGYGEQS